MNFYNIGFNEDGEYFCEEGKLEEYKWKGFLSVNGMCKLCKDWKNNIRDYFEDGDEWFEEDEDGIKEKEKFEEGLKKFKELEEKFGGVVLMWGVECDDNWILLYDENNRDIEEEVDEWLKREVDESEFEVN